MQQPNALSTDMLARIRGLALEQVELIDSLEAALAANDTPLVIQIAKQICGLEKEVTKQ
jgi:hypothetical protein